MSPSNDYSARMRSPPIAPPISDVPHRFGGTEWTRKETEPRVSALRHTPKTIGNGPMLRWLRGRQWNETKCCRCTGERADEASML